jgi:O-antigen ligase
VYKTIKLYFFELITYGFILYWALLPSRFKVEVNFYDVTVFSEDISIILAFLLLVPILSFYARDIYANMTLLLFTIIIIWGIISIEYQLMGEIAWKYNFYSLIITFFSMAVGYSMALSSTNKELFLTRLSGLLTLIFVLYAVESLLGLGFRSTLASYVNDALGIQRLKGPLGGAAVIGTIMVPVIAVHFSNVLKRDYKIYHFTMMLMTVICVILTGSRASFIGLFIFIILLLIRIGSMRSVFLFLMGSIIIVGIMQSFMSFDRYTSIEDTTREQTFQTSISMVLESPKTLILGQGSGEIWPWYYSESQLRAEDSSKILDNLKLTRYGIVLYHPHSLFIGVLIELGLIALLLLLIILLLPIWKFWQKTDNRLNMKSLLIMGILATYPLLAVDYYLFKNWQISLIWWVFYFSTLLLREKKKYDYSNNCRI